MVLLAVESVEHCSLELLAYHMLQRSCDNGEHRNSSASTCVAGQLPLGGELHRVGYDIFDVVVSPLSFFDLWVQPHVRCRVRCVHQAHLPGALSMHAMLYLPRAGALKQSCGRRQLSEPECVDIQCVDFQLRSSPAVERLRLNERVRFAVTTRFSCEGAPGRGPLLFPDAAAAVLYTAAGQ